MWSGHSIRVIVGVCAALSCVVVACGNANQRSTATTTTAAVTGGNDVGASKVDAPGVTATEISVGGIVSATNPIGGSFESAYDGVEAYFDMVNAKGGVDGRKLKIAERVDDQAMNNKAAATAMVDDDVFAILPVATLLFTGANELAASGIPTFGWNINEEWGGTPDNPKSNMFGHSGSYLKAADPRPSFAYVAEKLKAHRIGVLAYAVPQSADCAQGVTSSLEKYGQAGDAKVVFSDKSLAFGEANLSVQVQKMKEAGVQLVMTCMDNNGVVTLAKEMKKQQLDAKQYLLNAYDHAFVQQFGDLFEGSVVRIDFAPFETEKSHRPAGLDEFLSQMEKLGKTPTENAAVGWINANMFVDGLRAAGPDFTRQKVIDGLNAMTAWNGKGMTPPIDWTKRHTASKLVTECGGYLTIEHSTFVPAFNTDGKPFTCLDATNTSELTATSAG
jgi:ABC-type branched-subunit amino acid transport system substrate-binding protein